MNRTLRRYSGPKSNGLSAIGAKIEMSKHKKYWDEVTIEPFLDYWGNKIKDRFVIQGYILEVDQ